MSWSWEETFTSTAPGGLSSPSIIVGDPVATTVGDLTTIPPPAVRSTSTTTKTVYAPEAIGYFPGPDPSSTVNCETPDYTAFVTSISYGNRIGCRKLGTANQHIYHIYATSCIPAESPHVLEGDPYLTQCNYGIAQYCNKFSFSSPDASFVACYTIANQTQTNYLWPSQWSSQYAEASISANDTSRTAQSVQSATATATATATAEPIATSAAPGLGAEAEENPHTSVPVIAGVSAVAVIAFTACLVLLAIVWKRGRSTCCSRRARASASSEENHVGQAEHGANPNSEKKCRQELSAGEAHIHELDGTTVASPRGVEEDDVFAGHWLSDTHAQTGTVSGKIRPGLGSCE
ncbi:hypothetical protein LTR70_002990 [Exophiala xenobiotica]|uniref:Uncharacterized protein n=1 Tax=Lithohypha guttulata TaxID=1690604 RepID=A0ABR0K885_9EURO|nr:hypothetical protein LTR24_005670 [Lithohypha guttulata]KAK5324360.1 hypothetical protein LTR70_002990 [Exophiala xenobiotica]